MIQKSLIKSILPGLLPLFIFIIADEIWGTKVGLYVALGFGIIELVYTYITTKKIEKFILTDTILLVVLGGISIILDNEIFFKLKPALIEAILAVILGFSAFSSKNIVLSMSQRYMKNMNISDAQSQMMQKSLKGLFFITIIHVLLIIYSAYFLSNEAWAFISGGLFYIIFVMYFALEFIKNKFKRKSSNEELLPEIDEKGKIISIHPRSKFHNNNDKKMLHPVIHVHVFNSKGEIYLQKRPINKIVQPGKWDTAVGGHISAGENIEQALIRETSEEIGLKDLTYNFIKQYIWETNIERELVYLFISKTDKNPIPNANELDGGKFWSFQEIEENFSEKIFTPNLLNEFQLIKTIIE